MSKPLSLGVISPIFARPILDYAQFIDVDIYDFYESRGMGEFCNTVYAKDTTQVPGFPLRLLMQYIHSLGFEDFGLQAAFEADRQSLVPLLNKSKVSPTNLYEVLVNFCLAVNHFLSTFNFIELESTKDGIFLRRNQYLVESIADETMELYMLTLLMLYIQQYLGKQWHPSIVWLAQTQPRCKLPPLYSSGHVFYSKPVGKIYLSVTELTKTLPTYIKRTQLQSHKTQNLLSGSAVNAVLTTLEPYALHALPNFNTVSSILGCHPKQLQTRMAKEGKGFRQLVLELRRIKAEELMKKTDFDITRIAIEVGYQNQTHFSRAMKPLFGMSPLKKMKLLREQDSFRDVPMK